jgi:hypothetical protein
MNAEKNLNQSILNFSSKFQQEVRNKEWAKALATLDESFRQNVVLFASYETSVRLLPLDDFIMLHLINSPAQDHSKRDVELDYLIARRQVEDKINMKTSLRLL